MSRGSSKPEKAKKVVPTKPQTLTKLTKTRHKNQQLLLFLYALQILFSMSTDIHACLQTDIHTDRQSCRQTYMQTCSQTDMQTDIHKDRQSCRQTCRQTYMQTDLHTDRQTCHRTSILLCRAMTSTGILVPGSRVSNFLLGRPKLIFCENFFFFDEGLLLCLSWCLCFLLKLGTDIWLRVFVCWNERL